MIRTIIADNEVWVCKLIEHLVDWEALGFSIIGLAYDGEELLALAEQHQPDLIITDIQMPGKNGIEVIEQLRQRHLSPAVIIISGYNDFEYAKSAIDLGVFSYLLKPLEKETLTAALLKVKQALLSREQQQQELSVLQQQLDQSRQQQFHLYISSLFKGDATPLPLHDVNTQFDRHFDSGLFRILLFAIDPQTADHPSTLKIYPYISNALADMFRSPCHDLFYMEQQPFYLAILNYGTSKDQLICSLLEDFLCDCTASIPSASSNSLTLGVGKPVSDIRQLTDSYITARNAIHSRTQLGLKQIIFGDELTAEAPPLSCTMQNQISDFVNSYAQKEDPALLVDRLLEQYDTADIPYAVYEFALLLLKTAFASVSDEVRNTYDARFHMQNDYLNLEQAKNVKEIKRFLCSALSALKSQNKDLTAETNIIDIVKDYIDRHLDHDISLNDLAALVHFNPNYLSELFKKETGETFIKYITFKRVEAAKEYLADLTLRSSEVAAKVGYNDASYFNRVFKSYVGVTPKQYRRMFIER